MREPYQPLGRSVASVGTVRSTRIVWARQAEPLPATSNARVSSSCTPSAEIVNEPVGPDCTGWPSSRHSTRSTPEPESVAETVIATGETRQVLETVVVVSTGGVASPVTASMVKLSVRQPELLPAASSTRVSSVWAPLPVTVAVAPAAPVWSAPPSTRHSTAAIEECASVPVTATVYGLSSGEVGVAVVLTGGRVSIRTCSARQPDALPAMSTTRVSNRWSPEPETVACRPEAPLVTAPPSTRHCTSRTPETSSAPPTTTA